MAARPENYGEVGLSKVAHAIRRSTALHVAMSITPPESTVEDMLATADRLAAWIGGRAAEEEEHPLRPVSLGKSWHETLGGD